MVVEEALTTPTRGVEKTNMNDGNKLANVYGKKSKGAKKVKAREYDKSTKKLVPHGTNTVPKGSPYKQKVTKVTGHKKMLTDGGYMYV